MGKRGGWGRSSQPPEAIGVLRQSPQQPPEAKGSGEGDPRAGRFLQFFNKNTASRISAKIVVLKQ